MAFYVRLGLRDVIALHEIDSVLNTTRELFPPLHPLGQRHCSDRLGQARHRAHYSLSIVAQVDRGDNRSIDLDDVRLDDGYPFEIRVVRAEVVHNYENPRIVIVGRELLQMAFRVRAGLHHFERNRSRSKPIETGVLHDPVRTDGCRVQDSRVHVEKEQQRLALGKCAETFERAGSARTIELQGKPGLSRLREKRARGYEIPGFR
jgi:hypothetical protein